MKAIRSCLISNKDLKKLKLDNLPVFDEDISTRISFKLKELSLGLQRFRQNAKENLNLFLKAQSDSLETLETMTWMGFEVMRTVLSMPCLKSLTLNGITFADPEEFAAENFPQNHSVTSLDFNNFCINEMTDSVLKLFPNVVALKLFCMNDGTSPLIVNNCKSLKYFSVVIFQTENIENESFFLNLEEFFSECIRGYCFELFKKLNGKRKSPLVCHKNE